MKKAGFLLIFAILLLPFVYSQQVIQTNPTPAPKETHWYSFLTSTWFLGLIALFILILIAGVITFFLARWLINYLKERTNIFWRLKKERQILAKIHKRYPAGHWWKVSKNTPIRLIKVIDGKPRISDPIGHYRGDYATHEGNIVISMNLVKNRKMFIFPITSLLVIPNKSKIEFIKKLSKGETQKITIDNVPKADDIVIWNQGEVLIQAEALSNIGMFYVPVLKTHDGNPIDLSLLVFKSLKEVVLNEFLYDQTEEFSKLAKKGMNINPFGNMAGKLSDANQNIETQQQQQK